MVSPTSRSIKLLKDDGWLPAVVERWNPHARIRQDLFGFADILAIQPGKEPLLVQVTSTGWASRIKKIVALPLAATALSAGFRIEVHGWRKLKSNKNRMTPIIVPILLADMEAQCHFAQSEQ